MSCPLSFPPFFFHHFLLLMGFFCHLQSSLPYV
jgi:hypothetical protein